VGWSFSSSPRRWSNAACALATTVALAACGARSALTSQGQGGATTTSTAPATTATTGPSTSTTATTSTGTGGGSPKLTTACLLVGGDIDVLAGDTWLWSGSTWTLATPPSAPSARDDAAVATLDGTVVVFGGYAALPNGSGEVDETWLWDGAAWTQAHPATSPSARTESAAATLDGTTVLFGGAGPFAMGDTWKWDGSTWTQLAPAHAPEPRSSMAMATLGGTVFLFGGAIGDLAQATTGNDTWQWDGTDWTELHPATSPSPRRGAAFAVAGDRMILFGGRNDTDVLGDTWAWDGTTWTELSPPVSPPARAFASAGAILDTMVLFAGRSATTTLDDTWVWSGSTWTPVDGPAPIGLESSGVMGCY
jgi:hypothetical protein